MTTTDYAPVLKTAYTNPIKAKLLSWKKKQPRRAQ